MFSEHWDALTERVVVTASKYECQQYWDWHSRGLSQLGCLLAKDASKQGALLIAGELFNLSR
jgi:hypothetical protein